MSSAKEQTDELARAKAEVAMLRELCAKATPGIVAWADEGDHYSICIETDDGKHRCVASIPYRNANWQNDLNFHVAARTALPALLDEIEELRRSVQTFVDNCPECRGTQKARYQYPSNYYQTCVTCKALREAIGSEKGAGKE